MKDNFSAQADVYAKYRPTYPSDLINRIADLVPEHHLAWDCGTGNGQVAYVLSGKFTHVIATDISENQIQHAARATNITYKVEPAEETSIEDKSVDLITVAQAVHWFDFDKFYDEVYRVLKNQGVIALLGYALFKTNTNLDAPIRKFCYETVGPYWDKERKYLNEAYRNLPFPFDELHIQNPVITFEWSLEEMLGYFRTWSSVQHYIRLKHMDPINLIEKELKELWPQKEKVMVNLELFSRIGKLKNR